MRIYHGGRGADAVDIPEDELEELNSLSRSRKVSRAELIRQAVAGFLAENRTGIEDSFGIWKQRGVDGVEYQEKLRREWSRSAANPPPNCSTRIF